MIVTHDYPDPDAIACAVALEYLAETVYGIKCRIVYRGIIGRMENRAMVHLLKLPVHKLRPGDFKKYSNVALIDTQPSFENNPFPLNRKAVIVIDQHASVVKPKAELCIVDTECGATCVILAHALLLLKLDIPAYVATALTYGILSDTQNLYRANRADIVEAYLGIIPFCDMKVLSRVQNPSRSKKFFSTLGKAIKGAMVGRRLVISHLGCVENPDLVAQMADFLLTYEKMHWAFCTGRYRGKLYASLRVAKTDVKAAPILRDIFEHHARAGGHGQIAGGSLQVAKYSKDIDEETWQQTESGLVKRLLKRLKINGKARFDYPFQDKSSRLEDNTESLPLPGGN